MGNKMMALEVQGRGREAGQGNDGRTQSRTRKRKAYDESRRGTEPCGGDSSNTSTPREAGCDAEEED